MIVGAGTFFTSLEFALDGFIERRMILLFLPTVAHLAIRGGIASAGVIRDGYVVFGFPIDTGLSYNNFTIAS